MNLIFLGTAGSGKTTLCHAFGEWLKEQGKTVSFVNLDAGAENLPYISNFDIRSHFTVSEIMKTEKLGPNGAMLRANELLLNQIDSVLKKVSSLNSEFILIDTPGQLEAFVFKEAGPIFLQKLAKKSHSVAIFLIDAELTQYASNLIVGLLLTISVQIQLGINMIYVLHKADLIAGNSKLVKMLQNPDYFKKCIIAEKRGALTDLALIAQRAFAELAPSMRIITTTAKMKNNSGFDQLYDLIHEVFCACGDLT
jgi:GTPase SAR1 family protein